MAWYEYKAEAKPLYRQYEPGNRATIRDAVLIYGGLLLAVVVLTVAFVAGFVFDPWGTVLAIAIGVFYFCARPR